MLEAKFLATTFVMDICKTAVVVPGDFFLHKVDHGIERGQLSTPPSDILFHLFRKDLNEIFLEVLLRHIMGVFGPMLEPVAYVHAEAGHGLALRERVERPDSMEVDNCRATLMFPI